jgi:LuxR family maltose regulon positive regulatory protein
MAESDQALREIDRGCLPSEVLDSYSGSLAHLARAIGGAEAGDMARVRTHISVLAAHMPTLEYRLMFSALHALSCLWDGEAAVALQALSEDQRRDAPRGGVSRSDERLLTATRALLNTALGETGAANDEVRRLHPGDGIRLLLDAHLMLIGRRPELAFPRLMRIQPTEHDARMRAARDILLVCSALHVGDRDAAATALNRYASNALANGLTSPLLLVPAELRAELLAFGDSLGDAAAASLMRLAGFPEIFRLSRMRVSLTPREREILHALGSDLTHADIALKLGIAQNTLKAQTRTLYRKLEVGTRAEAIRAAYTMGLLAADSQPNVSGA